MTRLKIYYNLEDSVISCIGHTQLWRSSNNGQFAFILLVKKIILTELPNEKS